jgi:hypothetical protein
MQRSFLIFLLVTAGGIGAQAAADSGLLALAPAGATTIGSIDVAKARASDFGQYLLSHARPDDRDFEQMLEQTGFDPRRDVESVLFVSGPPQNGATRPSFVLLARGTFDEKKILAAAKAKGASVETYQGVQIAVHRGSSHTSGFGFLDTGVAVVADIPMLRQMIANRAQPTVFQSDLKNRIDTVSSNNDIWFASLAPGERPLIFGFNGGPRPERHGATDIGPQLRALQSITQASGGIRLGSTIQASFNALTRSPEDAHSLSDVARFFASMVEMRQDSDPGAAILAQALTTLVVNTNGNTVDISVSLPEKSLEQIAERHTTAGHGYFKAR